MNTSRLARIGALVAGIGIVGAWAAAGASAHVTVTAPGAAPGDSDATIVFRVPDESDTPPPSG
jgi:uncharacterized protein